MNIEYKFDYISKNSNGIFHKEFTFGEIESGLAINAPGDEIIARRMFSGKLDRNLRPIFEGDIIKNGLGEIIFMDSAFRVKWHDKIYKRIRGTTPELLFHNSFIAWEVIGNIYENKYLIE